MNKKQQNEQHLFDNLINPVFQIAAITLFLNACEMRTIGSI